MNYQFSDNVFKIAKSKYKTIPYLHRPDQCVEPSGTSAQAVKNVNKLLIIYIAKLAYHS